MKNSLFPWKHFKPLWPMLLVVLTIACGRKDQADYLLTNAVLISPDGRMEGDCVVIAGDTLAAIGRYVDLKKHWKATHYIDLKGAAVMPGLIDAHAHFFGLAANKLSADLRGCESPAEVVQRLKDFYAHNPGPWIIGRGWDQNLWNEGEFPGTEVLDSGFPTVPVYLTRIDGHALWINSAAARAHGITGREQVHGGQLEVRNGRFTGVLVDEAMKLAEVPSPTVGDLLKQLQETEQELFAAGVTSLTDAGLSRTVIEGLRDYYRRGLLRIGLYVLASDDDETFEWLIAHAPIDEGEFSVRGMKFYSDGALGSYGACLLSPYTDRPDQYGLLLRVPEYFITRFDKLRSYGLQVATHAIGDSANRLILKIYADLLRDYDQDRLRWRIEHCQVVHPEDIRYFREHKIIPSVQPTHATSDMAWAPRRLGPRLKTAYAYNTLLNAAGLLALGTDFPVEKISPIYTFYAATCRKNENHQPEGGFLADEAIQRLDALRGMTRWAAYAMHREHHIGDLRPGMLADLVVVDKDWLACPDHEIPATRVLMTFKRGKPVYQSTGQ